MADNNTSDNKAKRILIIDDDTAILEILSHVVEQEGFTAETSIGGESAFRRIEEGAPDLILLDLSLPGYGGYEILRRLQTSDASRVPIVIITGRSADPSMVDMIRQESNVVDFLTKPVDFSYLRGKLHQVLGTQPPQRVSRK